MAFTTKKPQVDTGVNSEKYLRRLRQLESYNKQKEIDAKGSIINDGTKPREKFLRRINNQNLHASRRDNRQLSDRNWRANQLLKDRYGVDPAASYADFFAGALGDYSNSKERTKVISNLNDRLKIKPEALDPTRKTNDLTKAMSKAFMSLDDYTNEATERVDNTFVRGEVARIREIAEALGNEEIESQAQAYLDRYKGNSMIEEGVNVGASLTMIRDLENTIRDSYNVEFLFGLTDGVYKAALPTGYRINEDTGEAYQWQDYAAAKGVADGRVASAQDYADSMEYTGIWSGGEQRDRDRIAEYQEYSDSIKKEDYMTGLPWWATMNA